MNEIDKGILRILQHDCRTSYSAIARELGVAESTVRYRVGRLIEERVITRFIALLDPRKIGLNITALALIKVEAKNLKEASKELASFRETHHLFKSTGEYDLVSVILAKNISHLNELMERIKQLPGIREVAVEVATQLIKVEPGLDLLN